MTTRTHAVRLGISVILGLVWALSLSAMMPLSAAHAAPSKLAAGPLRTSGTTDCITVTISTMKATGGNTWSTGGVIINNGGPANKMR